MRHAALLLALAAAASETIPSAEPPAASTAPARAERPAPAPENPWALTYGFDRRGDRYGRLDYRLRWSFSDLKKAPRELERPARSVEETLRGVLQGSRVDLYGVRVRPFRDLPLLPPLDAPFLGAPGASTSAARGAAPPRPRARRRTIYSWERLYEDLEDSARREAERFMVREGFDRALPQHSGAAYDQKKALGTGLLDLGRGALTDDPSPR